MEEKGESNKTLIPLWDGKHETWAHFLAEIKWTVSSLKKDERPLLAARIIRKNLQQGPPSLVQLLYKLEPEDFKAEEDVDRLNKFLEQSPLNKQPLPDAGQKIGQYYRKLHRRQQESVRQFLVREETVHSERLKALQRLLHEKELEFDQYDCTVAELKEFAPTICQGCGFVPSKTLFTCCAPFCVEMHASHRSCLAMSTTQDGKFLSLQSRARDVLEG